MKVKCLKTVVDINKIVNGINIFETRHNQKSPSYIIMNNATKTDLNIPDVICGIPIAISKFLEYGEVDII